jgi:choline dehydrogenase-like flavoprotein
VGEVENRAYDAIVVGSGFGGAVAACRLAQAGYRLLIIERGRRYAPGDFPALPDDAALLPNLARWTWQQDHGLWDIQDLGELTTAQAAGYGGGSLVYANVHLRPPVTVFDTIWPETFRNRVALDPYFDLVAHMLDVAPIDEHSSLGGALAKTAQFEAAAASLGREAFRPPLAIARQSGENPHGRWQAACNGCARCCSGCPVGAKNTLDYNYLAVAEKEGAEVRTQCEVLGFRRVEGGLWAVDCRDYLRRPMEITFEAQDLFLCAGSLGSTRLLARYTAREREGRQAAPIPDVGVAYHPGGGALGVVYETTHPQHPSSGPTITSAVAQSRPTEVLGPKGETLVQDRFFMVQEGGFPQPLARLFGTFRAPIWGARNRLTRAGTASIDASGLEPLPPFEADAPCPAAPPLPSPVDAIVDALTSGDLHSPSGELRIAPTQLAAALPGLLDGLREFLKLEVIVDQTLDNVLIARQPAALRWLLERWPWASRTLRRVAKWFAYRAFGGRELIAREAFAALASGQRISRHNLAAHLVGYDRLGHENRTVFLAMGRDSAPGILRYEKSRDRLVADIDLYHLAPGYTCSEGLMADIAQALGGELRGNPAWAFVGRPIAVHNQGGLPMGAVTDEYGAVRGQRGLHVLDGSILPTSVGVNPASTIAAIAERSIRHFIARTPERLDQLERSSYAQHLAGARAWAARARTAKWAIEPLVQSVPIRTPPLALEFEERMQGYAHATCEDPGGHEVPGEETYRALEIAGRPHFPIDLRLTARVDNLTVFFEDLRHELSVWGTASGRLPGEEASGEYAVSGRMEVMVPRCKAGALTFDDPRRATLRELGVPYVSTPMAPPPERLLRYDLELNVGGVPWRLDGYKRVRDDPGLDAWRDTSHLFIRLLKDGKFQGAGVVHVDLNGFLFRQLPSFRVGHVRDGVLKPIDDPARIAWATGAFAAFFFGELQRVYLPELGTALGQFFGVAQSSFASGGSDTGGDHA